MNWASRRYNIGVHAEGKSASQRMPRQNRWQSLLAIGSLAGFCLLLCGPSLAQDQQTGEASSAPETTATVTCAADSADKRIYGKVLDLKGTGVAAASIVLTHEDTSTGGEVHTTDDGQFSLNDVAPGPFKLSISAPGFAPQTISGNLRPGESCAVSQVTLAMATKITEVRVELSPVEIAQEQLKDQEKQRVLGVIPNFYVSYVPDAAPLTPKQKFQLAWKSTIDPVSFGVTGVIAGVQQATDSFSGYGQGAQGYGKRYGASYADLVTSTFIGGALFPSIFKQDPRYFYKGTGSVRSRVLYAVVNSVRCKGDNGRWQLNYSGLLGSLASGGISNLYYPASDRSDAVLTVENTLIGIGEGAAINLLQEFVIRKFTSNVPISEPAPQQNTF
jgi:Carboxypeptidase regulatory-like domain